MKIENISTLKINRLTQEQYEKAKAEDKLNDSELYFTPVDESTAPSPSPAPEIDLSDIESKDDTFYIVDSEDRIIAQIDSLGLHVKDIKLGTLTDEQSIRDLLSTSGGGEVDVSGKLDANGWETGVDTPYLRYIDDVGNEIKLSPNGIYHCSTANNTDATLSFPEKSGTIALDSDKLDAVTESEVEANFLGVYGVGLNRTRKLYPLVGTPKAGTDGVAYTNVLGGINVLTSSIVLDTSVTNKEYVDDAIADVQEEIVSDKDEFHIVDKDGNIVATIDKDGVHTTAVKADTMTVNGTDVERGLVTDTERSTWNAKSNFSGSYNDLTDKPNIPTSVTVDSTLSTTSTNPVQNKAIAEAFEGLDDTYVRNDDLRKTHLTSGITIGTNNTVSFDRGNKSAADVLGVCARLKFKLTTGETEYIFSADINALIANRLGTRIKTPVTVVYESSSRYLSQVFILEMSLTVDEAVGVESVGTVQFLSPYVYSAQEPSVGLSCTLYSVDELAVYFY